MYVLCCLDATERLNLMMKVLSIYLSIWHQEAGAYYAKFLPPCIGSLCNSEYNLGFYCWFLRPLMDKPYLILLLIHALLFQIPQICR